MGLAGVGRVVVPDVAFMKAISVPWFKRRDGRRDSPAQSPQKVVSKIAKLSLKNVKGSQVVDGKLAIGRPQVEGTGVS